MVAETAKIARADVGADEFLSVISWVVLKHEIRPEDSGAIFLIMKAFPIVQHLRGHDNLVENLPVVLMLQGAFKAKVFVARHQIYQVAILVFRELPRFQNIINAWVGRAIVQVAHHDDFRRITFWSNGIN